MISATFERRVRDIDWSRFHDGPELAGEVVALAAATTSDACRAALDSMRDRLIHRRLAPSPATATMLPLMLELLVAGPELADMRRSLIRFIQLEALGDPERFFDEPFGIEQLDSAAIELERLNVPRSVIDGTRALGSAASQDEPVRRQLLLYWRAKTLLSVERELGSLVSLLEDRDEVVAQRSIVLVSSLVHRRAELAPRLRSLVANPSFAGRRGHALLALARMGERVEEEARVLMDSDAALDGLYAAAAEIYCTQEPSEVARVRFTNLSPTFCVKSRCAFTSTVATLVARCLLRAPPPDQSSALEMLLNLMEAADGLSKLTFVYYVLELTFAGERSARLTSLQCRALAGVVEFSRWRLDKDELRTILEQYGLPGTKKGLQKMLT